MAGVKRQLQGLVTTTFLQQQQFPVSSSSAFSAIFAHCWRNLSESFFPSNTTFHGLFFRLSVYDAAHCS